MSCSVSPRALAAATRFARPWWASQSAATPAVSATAKLVPWLRPTPSGTAARHTFWAGAEMSTAEPLQLPRHFTPRASTPATAMHSSNRAGQTTVPTQLPAAASTMTSACTARRSARCMLNEKIPPRLMVITCAPCSTAQSTASATVPSVICTTLLIARIGMWEIAGALPVTVPEVPDTTTLAVPVP